MKFYQLMLCGLLSSALTVHARCIEDNCPCDRQCVCGVNDVKTKPAISVNSIAEFDRILADNERVIVKFFPGKCSGCAFGAYFNQLMAASIDDTVFVNFGVGALDRAAVLAHYRLTRLPAIVLFENGVLSEQLKP